MISSLRDLRNKYSVNLKISETASQIRYFRKTKIDWDVYLPSKGFNLQRDYVWSLEQKRELIRSVLIGRHIPHCAVIWGVDPDNDNEDINIIIDGKQRLSSLFDFVDDKFTIVIDDEEYLFSQLPKEYQVAIDCYHFRYYVVNEDYNKRMTDEEKITWFKFINFAGTPQDLEHLNKL